MKMCEDCLCFERCRTLYERFDVRLDLKKCAACRYFKSKYAYKLDDGEEEYEQDTTEIM